MSAAVATLKNLGPGVPSKEAIHTIGAAFEVDPEHLAQRYGAPSDPGVPPGLGTYSKLASGVESWVFPPDETTPAKLVSPALAKPKNPLLAKGPAATSQAMPALFRKGKSSGSGLIKPAGAILIQEDKAGATFAEALGDGTQTQNADRIIHAIDGLRKSHDEDKGLQKGLLTSVKEGFSWLEDAEL